MIGLKRFKVAMELFGNAVLLDCYGAMKGQKPARPGPWRLFLEPPGTYKPPNKGQSL